MSKEITVAWDNDKHTVIRMELGDRWMVVPYRKAFQQVQRMIANVGTQVDLMIIVPSRYIEPEVTRTVLQTFKQFSTDMTITIVEQSAVARQFFYAIRAMLPDHCENIHIVKTPEQAREVITTHRVSIADAVDVAATASRLW